MAKGYWIGHVDVVEPDAFREYARLAKAAVEKYHGEYLVRGGDAEGVEGTWRDHAVLIEFESFQQAMDCYHSVEYQAAKKVRVDASAAAAELLIVEGRDAVQPGLR